MRTPKIGDKFQHSDYLYTLEVINTPLTDAPEIGYEFVRCKCVASGLNNYYEIGIIAYYNLNKPHWNYLGNYAKSSNFTNLYNLLNDDV